MLNVLAIYVLMQFVLLLPFLLVLWGISRLLRGHSPTARTAAIVVGATLLFTPGWGPATITIVPVPFGLLLGVAFFTFRWSEFIGVMGLAPPWWYVIAFPVTASIVYVLRRLILSNWRWNGRAASTSVDVGGSR